MPIKQTLSFITELLTGSCIANYPKPQNIFLDLGQVHGAASTGRLDKKDTLVQELTLVAIGRHLCSTTQPQTGQIAASKAQDPFKSKEDFKYLL